MDRKNQILKQIKVVQGITNVVESSDFKEHIVPLLNKFSTFQPVDPAKYTKEEEFTYALKTENARANAYKELLSFLTSQPALLKRLQIELEKKEDYGI